MKEIRYAIIGCGKVSSLHAKALSVSEGSRLVAVCNHHLDKAQSFARIWNVNAYDDITSMITKEKVDVVIITTPHPAHKDNAIEAMRAGCHVLTEKPMATTVDDCMQMLDAALKYHKKLAVVSQRRWYPASQRIKKAIEEGKLGIPMLGEATVLGWRDEKYYLSADWRGKWESEGGGIVINQASHQLDLLHWYLGPVREVFGFWKNINHPYIEVEDTAVGVVLFQSGAMASITLSNSQRPGLYAKVHIHGDSAASVGVQTDGGAMFLPGQEGIIQPPLNDLWTIAGDEDKLKLWEKQDTDYFATIDATWYFFKMQIEDFTRSLLEDKNPACDGLQGLETVKLIEGIYSSGRSGKPVIYR
ncbi:MAG: Gfo/Idh/MocA family oxidoreductase [Sphaerochaetaceae bacterium]